MVNFDIALKALDAGAIDDTKLKSLFSCTVGQAAELDEILGTRPSNQNSVPAAKWARDVIGILGVALLDNPETPVTTLTTVAGVRTALGLSNP
jgi:hypothetical protein